jgi:hypothetical protein
MFRMPWARRTRPSPPVALPPPADPPRLATDSLRTMLAGFVAVVPTVPIVGVLGAVSGISTRAALTITSLYVFYSFYALAHAALTWLALRKADARTLAHWMRRTVPRGVLARVQEWVFGNGSAPSWSAQTSLLAVFAVVAVQFSPELRGEPLLVAAAVAVVITSWVSAVVAYAVHYARLVAVSGGAEFRDPTAPVFADWLHVSMSVMSQAGTGDVRFTARPLRGTATGQAVLAVLFSTVIVALLVSLVIGAGAEVVG